MEPGGLKPRYVTAHQAELRLSEVGVCRSQAREVLRAGLAGPPTRRGRTRLYDAAAVAALLQRRRLCWAQLDRHVPHEFPGGLLLLRRFVDSTLPRGGQIEQVAPGWDLGLWLPALTLKRWRDEARAAVVVTVAGFVAACFELDGTVPDEQDPKRRLLLLTEAGAWADDVTGDRWELGRGKQWQHWPPARRLPTWHVAAGQAPPWLISPRQPG